MKYCYLFLCFLFLIFSSNQAAAQCPGCIISLPTLPADTVYISDVDDGQAGSYFDSDMSFRLPITTTYADTTISPPLPISNITIISVTNIPPGLEWEANQLDFDTALETDGCVKFCGTPLVADSFYVNVVVEAQVSIFSQETSFTLPFYIAPASTITEGFSMTNNVACGSTIVNFTNNVAANGNEGVSYFWDFGNGQTSTAENPNPVDYSVGNYSVTYEAVIDTSGYFLNEVTVTEASCTDLFGTPDLYIEIVSPNGNVLFVSETVDNTNPPVTFAVPSVPIGAGNYEIRVTDVDPLTEVNCGIVTFNFATDGTINDGDLAVDINLINPMTTVTSQGDVFVYSAPEAPIISPNLVENLCENETVILQTSAYPNIQWFNDTIALQGETSNVLEVNEMGEYRVQFMTEEGCISESDVVQINFLDLPNQPNFTFSENELTLFAPESLPVNYSLQWLLNGNEIEGETGQIYCMLETGNYSLVVTDLDSGCTNSYSNQQIFFPNQGCALSGIDDLNFNGLEIFPNPTNDFLNVLFEENISGVVQIFNINGQLILQEKIESVSSLEFDIHEFLSGVYLLQINTEGKIYRERFLRL